MPRKLTHEEYAVRLEQANPSIELVGEYKGSASKIACRCKICGYEWLALPSVLLKGKGCQKCAAGLSETGSKQTGVPDRKKTDFPAQQETAKKPQKVRKESQEMKSPSLQPKVAGDHQKQTEAEPTNKERFFGSDARIAATLKQISLCCNNMKCEECPIQEICCQPPIEFLKWLDKCNG